MCQADALCIIFIHKFMHAEDAGTVTVHMLAVFRCFACRTHLFVFFCHYHATRVCNVFILYECFCFCQCERTIVSAFVVRFSFFLALCGGCLQYKLCAMLFIVIPFDPTHSVARSCPALALGWLFKHRNNGSRMLFIKCNLCRTRTIKAFLPHSNTAAHSVCTYIATVDTPRVILIDKIIFDYNTTTELRAQCLQTAHRLV